ncbi:PLP-dependent aminotransferase family protein [Luteibacter sp. SG786]|uniref:aminotransferase-like domain-containing protein n=1 Tax=Luteibacter sp. SG786 TaxID=2587130 RepID=UPI0014220F34|nr:PLP-dependent aminotransferase family protein [Luteibacter sp. SG786]NII54585.1 DNA-binding transcriptional MocR family regulator [Luteibacter sp. SG786]
MDTTYNLAVNLPPRRATAALLGETLATGMVTVDDLAYPDPAGAPRVRLAIAGWMQRAGGHGPVDPALLTLTNGARHALALALRPVARMPAAALFVEAQTYQGIRALARAMDIRCIDVATDEHGMRPDALLEASRGSQARAVYVQPTLHNPTTATMPLSRRIEIAMVAEQSGLTLIEGDVYSPLAWHGRDALPPFAVIAPGRTVHAGGIGKILGPGLRMGWLLHPDASMQADSVAAIERELDGLPAWWPTIVARWMEDGTAEACLRGVAETMTRRAAMARRVLGSAVVTAGASLHAWVPHRHADDLEKRLLGRGVRVAAGNGFVAAAESAQGVRLALGAEESTERLEAALGIVARELESQAP